MILKNQGFGYEVFLKANDLSGLETGQTVCLYIHQVVKEDGHFLYGFKTRKEWQVFKKLILVSGIGPRIGLAILNACEPKEIGAAISREDIALFSLIPGIGAKTAKRLILELKGKIDVQENWDEEQKEGGKTRELVDALESLGYGSHEIQRALGSLVFEPNDSIEIRLRKVLKKLSENR